MNHYINRIANGIQQDNIPSEPIVDIVCSQYIPNDTDYGDLAGATVYIRSAVGVNDFFMGVVKANGSKTASELRLNTYASANTDKTYMPSLAVQRQIVAGVLTVAYSYYYNSEGRIALADINVSTLAITTNAPSGFPIGLGNPYYSSRLFWTNDNLLCYQQSYISGAENSNVIMRNIAGTINTSVRIDDHSEAGKRRRAWLAKDGYFYKIAPNNAGALYVRRVKWNWSNNTWGTPDALVTVTSTKFADLKEFVVTPSGRLVALTTNDTTGVSKLLWTDTWNQTSDWNEVNLGTLNGQTGLLYFCQLATDSNSAIYVSHNADGKMGTYRISGTTLQTVQKLTTTGTKGVYNGDTTGFILSNEGVTGSNWT